MVTMITTQSQEPSRNGQSELICIKTFEVTHDSRGPLRAPIVPQLSPRPHRALRYVRTHRTRSHRHGAWSHSHGKSSPGSDRLAPGRCCVPRRMRQGLSSLVRRQLDRRMGSCTVLSCGSGGGADVAPAHQDNAHAIDDHGRFTTNLSRGYSVELQGVNAGEVFEVGPAGDSVGEDSLRRRSRGRRLPCAGRHLPPLRT